MDQNRTITYANWDSPLRCKKCLKLMPSTVCSETDSRIIRRFQRCCHLANAAHDVSLYLGWQSEADVLRIAVFADGSYGVKDELEFVNRYMELA